jgi:hypothetical protein
MAHDTAQVVLIDRHPSLSRARMVAAANRLWQAAPPNVRLQSRDCNVYD